MKVLAKLQSALLFLLFVLFHPFQAMRKNKKGIAAIILSLVVALVALAIIIPVGLMIQSSLTTITKISGMSATANSTVDTTNNNIYSAFNLVAIVPIIAGAAVIISVIMGAFAWKQQG